MKLGYLVAFSFGLLLGGCIVREVGKRKTNKKQSSNGVIGDEQEQTSVCEASDGKNESSNGSCRPMNHNSSQNTCGRSSETCRTHPGEVLDSVEADRARGDTSTSSDHEMPPENSSGVFQRTRIPSISRPNTHRLADPSPGDTCIDNANWSPRGYSGGLRQPTNIPPSYRPDLSPLDRSCLLNGGAALPNYCNVRLRSIVYNINSELQDVKDDFFKCNSFVQTMLTDIIEDITKILDSRGVQTEIKVRKTIGGSGGVRPIRKSTLLRSFLGEERLRNLWSQRAPFEGLRIELKNRIWGHLDDMETKEVLMKLLCWITISEMDANKVNTMRQLLFT